jgi:hypothetical protein
VSQVLPSLWRKGAVRPLQAAARGLDKTAKCVAGKGQFRSRDTLAIYKTTPGSLSVPSPTGDVSVLEQVFQFRHATPRRQSGGAG